MARLNIIHDNDPMIRQKSHPIEKITPRILTLLDDMAETMKKADGCGIAAVQVGVLRRAVVVWDEATGRTIELINPEIIEASGSQNEIEGCLSVPDRWGVTERPMDVTVRALDRNGKTIIERGSGLLARAFCHEIDHLDGKLFLDCSIRVLTREDLEKMAEDDDK